MRKVLIAGLLLLGAVAFAGKYEDEMTERMKTAEEKAQAGWDSGVRADMVNASLDLEMLNILEDIHLIQDFRH